MNYDLSVSVAYCAHEFTAAVYPRLHLLFTDKAHCTKGT